MLCDTVSRKPHTLPQFISVVVARGNGNVPKFEAQLRLTVLPFRILPEIFAPIAPHASLLPYPGVCQYVSASLMK
uniref:Uncharacterized protein n=1 Tax=Anguilla anguilla TaxID=7936 RepID=A0A0E9T5W0_ANGAN